MATYNTRFLYIKDIPKRRVDKTWPEGTQQHKHGIIRSADIIGRMNMVTNLSSMGFVSAATSLIITRTTGVGKTYLSRVIKAEADRCCGPVISGGLICWGIFRTTRIISGNRSGIEKGWAAEHGQIR